MQVQSLGQEDPLEKGMATHSSIFACRIPWMEEPGGLQSMGSKELDTTERLYFHFSQYSYLENPTDRGAGWATIHGVKKSQTQLSD